MAIGGISVGKLGWDVLIRCKIMGYQTYSKSFQLPNKQEVLWNASALWNNRPPHHTNIHHQSLCTSVNNAFTKNLLIDCLIDSKNFIDCNNDHKNWRLQRKECDYLSTWASYSINAIYKCQRDSTKSRGILYIYNSKHYSKTFLFSNWNGMDGIRRNFLSPINHFTPTVCKFAGSWR